MYKNIKDIIVNGTVESLREFISNKKLENISDTLTITYYKYAIIYNNLPMLIELYDYIKRPILKQHYIDSCVMGHTNIVSFILTTHPHFKEVLISGHVLIALCQHDRADTLIMLFNLKCNIVFDSIFNNSLNIHITDDRLYKYILKHTTNIPVSIVTHILASKNNSYIDKLVTIVDLTNHDYLLDAVVNNNVEATKILLTKYKIPVQYEYFGQYISNNLECIRLIYNDGAVLCGKFASLAFITNYQEYIDISITQHLPILYDNFRYILDNNPNMSINNFKSMVTEYKRNHHKMDYSYLACYLLQYLTMEHFTTFVDIVGFPDREQISYILTWTADDISPILYSYLVGDTDNNSHQHFLDLAIHYNKISLTKYLINTYNNLSINIEKYKYIATNNSIGLIETLLPKIINMDYLFKLVIENSNMNLVEYMFTKCKILPSNIDYTRIINKYNTKKLRFLLELKPHIFDIVDIDEFNILVAKTNNVEIIVLLKKYYNLCINTIVKYCEPYVYKQIDTLFVDKNPRELLLAACQNKHRTMLIMLIEKYKPVFNNYQGEIIKYALINGNEPIYTNFSSIIDLDDLASILNILAKNRSYTLLDKILRDHPEMYVHLSRDNLRELSNISLFHGFKIYLRVLTPVSNGECIICYNNTGECIKTTCNHIYHLDCLNTWLDRNDTCPYCRKDI
jgi:hypothetical protein